MPPAYCPKKRGGTKPARLLPCSLCFLLIVLMKSLPAIVPDRHPDGPRLYVSTEPILMIRTVAATSLVQVLGGSFDAVALKKSFDACKLRAASIRRENS